MYSKHNSPVLLINTIFKHWNCFLSFVAMDGNDGYGLKRDKVGPTFSSFNAMPAVLWLVFADVIYLTFSSLLYRSHFVYGVKVLSKDFSTELHTLACERQTFLLAHRRWGTFREKELNSQNVSQWRWARRRWGDERGGTQLAKRTSMAMSEEKRQPFAGYNTLMT